MKKIILSEEQLLTVINESLSDKIYYYCSISSAFAILATNKMYCQSALANSGADNLSNKYLFYISFARNKTNYEGFGVPKDARIEFDGSLLNQQYKGKSVNYWGADDVYVNKYTYMRRATGVKNLEQFKYVKIDKSELPIDVNVKKVDKRPSYPTRNSPEYIQIGEEFFQKKNKPINEPQDKSYKYTEIDPDLAVNAKQVTNHKFTYPDEYSPEYVTFGGKTYKKEPAMPTSMQQHQENEMEDRLFTNKPFISNIRKYIKRIDILVDLKSELPEGYKQTLYNYSSNPKVFIYDNKRDFNAQSDNTINEYINSLECFGFKQPAETTNAPAVIDALTNFFHLLTITEKDWKKNDEFIAKTLKKYGLDQLIRTIINGTKRTYGKVDSIISSIASYVGSMSKSPSEFSQKALHLITDIMREKRCFNWASFRKMINKQISDANRGNSTNWDEIDCYTQKQVKILELNGVKFNITNDRDTDFWYIFGLKDKASRYNFIDNLIHHLHYATNGDWQRDGDWINSIRDKSKNKFIKYLQHLAHKKVTLGQINEIFSRIGYSFSKLCEDEYYDLKVYYKTMDYWSYTSNNIYPPYDLNEKEDLWSKTDKYSKMFYAKEENIK